MDSLFNRFMDVISDISEKDRTTAVVSLYSRVFAPASCGNIVLLGEFSPGRHTFPQ